MKTQLRLCSLFVCLLSALPGVAATLAGHWEGSVQAGEREIKIEMDLTNENGTITIPAQKLKGLPLRTVSIEGAAVRIYLREEEPFKATLSEDGKSLGGEWTIGGSPVPLTLTRTGEARFEAPEKSSPIRKEWEGTWNGTLTVNGSEMRLRLSLSRQADGSSRVTMANLDQGNLDVPASLTVDGTKFTLELKAIGGSYAAELSNEGTTLAGTYKQGAVSMPLTFRKAAQ